ncbi:Domain of uncharacterised function (DUF955) [Actinobaculum suis]|uniref:Domain of uncharacterized function (DUF955) n=1 Tax=Actinobaculum suis TaxID=1657 RepID=A0A7Z8Y8Y6_9ACTO|nr:ImmA/IrrE family metallo-endopeptidase [Actinobaculum suis]VDG76201.1 Domain of uncharacterised function (DUF955) [Actinobaculum suis]
MLPSISLKPATEEQLIAELYKLGVCVVYAPISGASGHYYHETGLVVVDSRTSPRWQIWTLAHELVHAWRGDDGPQPASVEALVDRTAARLLISGAEYALAEQLYGPNIALIAEELGVVPECVEAYRAWLTQTRGGS